MVYRKKPAAPFSLAAPQTIRLHFHFYIIFTGGLIVFLQMRKQIQPEYIRDNPVFDIQVNQNNRNEINFQAFRLSPKTFDLYGLGYAKLFHLSPRYWRHSIRRQNGHQFLSIF